MRWWLKYTLHVRKVDPFTHLTEHSPLSAKVEAEHLLMDFGVWLALARPSGRPISWRTIRRYLSQVMRWHLLEFRTHLCGGLDRSRILAMVNGIRNALPGANPRPIRRWGVRTQDLRDAMRRFLQTSGEDVMWRALCTTAFCALMRGCELGLQRGETFDPTTHLTRADLTFRRSKDGSLYAILMMRVGKSATRQKTVPVMMRSGGSLLDPVAALLAMVQADPVPRAERSTTPLFRRANGAAVTVDQVRKVVKVLMAKLGLDPKRFGAHSLRIGGATAALAAHLHPSAIRAAGRWASDVYQVYTKVSRQSASMLATVIGSTPFHDLERNECFVDEELMFTNQELIPGDLGFVDQDMIEDALR